MRGIAAGALVRWTGGDVDRWGVVVAVLPDGRSAAVHFDDGETLQFAWPAENLIRVVFEKGQTVKLEATGERGVISGVTVVSDRVLYVVSLSDGSSKTVTEDGVRPAVETDPLARMRSGDLDSARSVNLRVAATRLLFAHQYDDLSSLSNSRVEIKPHQVAVLHRVASTFPQPLRDRIRIAIDRLAEEPHPRGAEKLAGRGDYRVRVGNYRIVYAVDDPARLVLVARIAHRRDVYRR